MKSLVSLAAFAAGVLSQTTFEPSDFNITEALLDNGVNISAIPQLAPFVERSLLSGCSVACSSLKLIFGDDQVETQSETTYNAFVSAFWSRQQRDIAPQCIIKPEKALDVSTSILLSRLTQCPFAVRSGGHSAVPGGSNIAGGITVSMEKMNKTTLSADKKTVTFQPGQTWYDVYTKLEKDNITIIGGRVADVGVGGLTLGGGISYFSSMYGLACDNVLSYEVVTAAGLVINVSQNSFPDLYWALRGGGNNFGIVTKFTVVSIPRAPTMWGGNRMYLEAQHPALITAYVNLGKNAVKDGKAHQILSFGWGGDELGAIALAELEYADPNPNATIFNEYNSIGGAIQDITAVKSLAELAKQLEDTKSNGRRQLFWTWCTELDEDMANAVRTIYFEEVTSITDAQDVQPSFSLQVITEPIIEKTAQRGGNPLGLDPKEGPLMLALIAISWTNAADDDRLYKFAKTLRDRSVAAAEAAGKANDYIYMNYGSPYQNVVAGYGAANQARLKAISKKYDPTGVFETLQPGYFKLDGAPLGEFA